MKKMIKNAKMLIAAVLATIFCFTAICLTGCSEDPPPPETEKTVKSIGIASEPTKVSYFVGEDFSVEGGTILVTYDDDTTEIKKLSDEGVTYTNVNTAISDESKDTEEKTVTVRYMKKSASFKVTVSYKMFNVTFDYGYAGKDNETKTVRSGAKVTKPTDPTRDNHVFEGWYADDKFTAEFDFNTAVTSDTTVYANWKDVSKTYYTVSFDLNYKRSVKPTTQTIEAGNVAVKPQDPTRTGYEFAGWYTTDDCTTAFDFTTQIAANTTVYAKWNLTKTGKDTYVFEAEDINFNGKSGPGLSGTASGVGMIQYSENHAASGNRFVGYQYDLLCMVDFNFVSDRTISDAKIVLRLSAELRDFTIDSTSYIVTLNGRSVSYSPISFTDVPKGSSEDIDKILALPFEDYVIIEGATIVEGGNSIVLQPDNNEALEGTTMLCKAPLIDCLKIETEAILTWDATLGLPRKNY